MRFGPSMPATADRAFLRTTALHATRWSSRAAIGAAAAIVLWACATSGDPTPLDRSVPPVLSSAPVLKLPPVLRRELPNGLELLMVEHHELPVVNFIMLVGTGAESDPDGREGLATLTAALLDEGTSERDALAIADQAAFLGATLSTSSGWDASRVSLQTTTAQLDSALALFADVIIRPTFPENELERLRRERLTALLQQRDSPPQIAEIAFSRIVFGEMNPYGQPLLGTERSISSLSREDIRRFYTAHYRPNNSTLIIVGDFKPDEMEQRVSALFKEWEKAEVSPPTFAPAPSRDKVVIYLIDKPGAPQASVRIGHTGTPRATPDYFTLLVANTVLGGSFTSRLNMNLRENKGYTYGAGSRFDMRKSAGPFVARAEVVAQKIDSALIEFMKELNAIRDTVPAEELDKAKQFLQLQLPDAFETTADIANQLVSVALYDLPLDYYDRYAESIGAVTQADVKRVATAHIEPSRTAIVIVGDRSVIEPSLRRLNLGEISVRDLNGAPISR